MLTGPAATIGKARTLRKEMSLPEVLLWRELRKRPGGFKFRRQHPAGPYILDFACLESKLAIEIDGEGHGRGDAPVHDEARDEWLANQGLRILRIPAREVLGNLDGVMRWVTFQASAEQPLHRRSGGPPPRTGEDEFCAAAQPLHQPAADEQARNAPGIAQPCRGHGDLLIPPGTGEDS